MNCFNNFNKERKTHTHIYKLYLKQKEEKSTKRFQMYEAKPTNKQTIVTNAVHKSYYSNYRLIS